MFKARSLLSFHIHTLQKSFVGADGDYIFLGYGSPISRFLLFSRKADYKLIEMDHTCPLVYLIAMSAKPSNYHKPTIIKLINYYIIG